jgi:RNA-binding protein Musashi
MSELESDLYGDLYENEEGDFTGTDPQEPVTAENEQEPVSKPIVQPVAPQKPADKSPAPSKPSTAPTAATNGLPIQSYTTPLPETSSSYPLQGTQHIPTYQQPTEYAAQEVSSSQDDGSYSSERTIRPSEMKDEGKMFIGGLNWDTTDESLRAYFTQFGKVDACTIMRDAAGRSRCFAFLTFEDPASVNAVMVREHFLDGKIIDPKRAIPRQEHQRATKLFIGGLAGSVTSESMRAFFSQFGKVVDSTVMLDRETGRSKGFGFVSFEDTNVQPFLGFGNLEIDGKMVYHSAHFRKNQAL